MFNESNEDEDVANLTQANTFLPISITHYNPWISTTHDSPIIYDLSNDHLPATSCLEMESLKQRNNRLMPNHLFFESYQFVRHEAKELKRDLPHILTGYYHCLFCRSASVPCKASLTIKVNRTTGEQISMTITNKFHSCVAIQPTNIVSEILDIKDEMNGIVYSKSIHDPSMTARDIAQNVMDFVVKI